jgi:lycopene cyclase domain-containing protein
MNLGRYSYLVSILVGAGVPLLVEYVLVSGTVRYYRRFLALVTLIMLIATWIWDGSGLAWRTWSYTPERTLGISLGGVPVETYLATLLVVPAIAIATLAWANLPLDSTAPSPRPRPPRHARGSAHLLAGD